MDSSAFIEDGHEVSIVGVQYDEKIEDISDVIIKRNTWTDNIELKDYYNKIEEKNRKRLKNKDKLKVNFNGNFDTNRKLYLVDLYNKGYEVIPTINNLKDIDKLEKYDNILLKPLNGSDGLGQLKCTKAEVENIFNKNYIIQPILEFESEVQFYFINNEFKYALEFTPSKIPVYPDAQYYKYNEKELKLAYKFANLNKDFIGLQRIDFIKLKDGRFLLLEIEDASPYLDLDRLSKKDRDNFINDYKEMIYKKFEESRNVKCIQ